MSTSMLSKADGKKVKVVDSFVFVGTKLDRDNVLEK